MTNQIQIALDPRIQIINDLMKHGDWYQKDIYELIQHGIDSGAVIGTNGVLKVGGTAIANAASAPGTASFTASFASSTAVAATAAMTLTGIALIGYTGLKVYQIYGQEERYIEQVASEAHWALDNLCRDCLKDESCPDRDPGGITFPLGKDLNELRNHEAFLAWINLEYEKIAGKQNEESLENQKKYKKTISKHIKPEAIQSGRFEKEMRIFCAANKILADYKFKASRGSLNLRTPSIDLAGEFAKSKSNTNAPFFSTKSWRDWWKDENAKAQDGIAKQIQALLKPGHNFEDLRKKFYGAYKAKMYAQCHQIKQIEIMGNIHNLDDYVYSEYHHALAEALGIDQKTKESELTSEQKEKIRKFKRLFYQYRYEGGECEFNAHDFFQIKFFDKFYKMIAEAQGDLIDSEKQFKRQFKGLVQDVTITLALGVFAGSLTYLNSQWKLVTEAHKARIARSEDALKSFQELGCSNLEQAKEIMGLKQQVQLGVPGAKEQLEFLQTKLKSFPSPSLVTCHEGICVGGEIRGVNLAQDDIIREAFENLPLDQALNYLQEAEFNEVYIPEVKNYINQMLVEIKEVGSRVVEVASGT